ncbi:MAG: D-alanyl-D-alanine carboxypeptidase, partial [Pseudomonadota bacterium]
SEHKFGKMMTAKARALGMNNTVLKNPHGLTQRGHYSTARDMAILSRHLFYDFPKYYNIFKRKTDRAAGRTIWNTNRLLSSYSGADGIKTGYTRAAGYNLAASAHRGRKRILAVVMGADSSSHRARKVARLLDLGFKRAKTNVRSARPQKSLPKKTRGRLLVKFSPMPPVKPGQRRSIAQAVAEVLATPAAAATPAEIQVSAKAATRKADLRRFAPRVAERPVPRPGGAGSVADAAAAVPKLEGALARVPIPLPRPVKLAAR